MIHYTHKQALTHSCCFSQEEIESQKQQHEARIIAIKSEEKQKMDKITKELDQKWTDALRYSNQDPYYRNVSYTKSMWTPDHHNQHPNSHRV